MSDNMKLWDAVSKTNPAHTKAANVRGNKITAIAPQTQIMAATEQWGPYGTGWGFKAIEFRYDLFDKTGIVIFAGQFYYPGGEFPITSSISGYKDGAQTKPDADFAKKVETDALTKALSKVGFNADIFMGLYDDHKYVQLMQAEFAKPVDFAIGETELQWIEATKADPLVLEQITDANYRAFIKAKAGV